MVLITESAKADPQIVDKIKGQLHAGKNIVITSGLLHALQGHRIEGHRRDARDRANARRESILGRLRAGRRKRPGRILHHPAFPRIRDFLTNDASASRASDRQRLCGSSAADGSLLEGHAFRPHHPGKLQRFVLASATGANSSPELFAAGFPCENSDAPSQVSLFVYDNNHFVVQSFRNAACHGDRFNSRVVPNNSKYFHRCDGSSLARRFRHDQKDRCHSPRSARALR